MPGIGVAVLSERRQHLLAGRIFELMAPYIDGTRSGPEIAACLSGAALPDQIDAALARLTRTGCLREHAHGVEDCEPGSITGPGSARGAAETLEGTVAILTLAAIDPEPIEEAVVRAGLRVGGIPDITMVATDDYLRDELEGINRDFIKRGRAWLLMRPRGAQIYIGPLFRPDSTGCWACLAHYVGINRQLELLVQEVTGAQETASCMTRSPAQDHLAANLALAAASEWLAAKESTRFDQAIMSFDMSSWSTHRHIVPWRPRCPECGEFPDGTPAPMPRPVRLRSSKKTYAGKGGHRSRTPEATLGLHMRHVSSVCGIVNSLERATPTGNSVMHVYYSGANSAVRRGGKGVLPHDLRYDCSGRGQSDIQAKVSGLCEALERYSGVFQGTEPRLRGTFEDVPGAIHPNDCMLISETQYRERTASNTASSRFSLVPARFDEDAEIEWSPVWSLSREEWRHLPTALCYYQYPHNSHREASCIACSNGSAAGNTLEEAILHGVLELIERDSVSIWWYNCLKRPSLDLDSFEEPYFERLRSELRGRGRDLWVLDVTSDLGIPVFAAVSGRADAPQQILMGFGAHLDARAGVFRALTELNQMLVAVERFSCADGDADLARWLGKASLQEEAYLQPDPNGLIRRAFDYPRLWTDDIKSDVEVCRRRVEQAGMELLVLDQTRAEVALPVVKVFVPGLRHFWRRLAPGRLYKVPTKLGWVERPLREGELNPVTLFF